MKKLFYIISAISCAIVMAFSLIACTDAGAPSHPVDKTPDYVVSADEFSQKLEEFLSDDRTNRTTYTDAERAAAEYLRAELVSYGYADDQSDDGKKMIREFGGKNAKNETVKSQNVVATYRPSDVGDGAPNVVIGAYYDNRFDASLSDDDPTDTYVTRSHGVLANGTGVATLLVLAEYLQTQKPELDFTVTIAFFGASAVNNIGVSQYYNKQMTVAEKRNTVLMIELQRLGVDHVYAFSDYRKTRRESFFDGVAAKSGLDVYKPTQKSPLILSLRALNGIPFYQWVQSGNFSVFFNNGIPTLNVVGANWETIDLTDREGDSHANVGMGKDDTLANLKRNYPDYAQKMATAGTLVMNSLTADGFIDAMKYDRDNFPDTDVLATDWIWYAVVLGVMAIAAVVMTLLSRRLIKKYPVPPVVPPVRRNVKMAVFGMEYEDANSNDIFIDLKRVNDKTDDIFPGIPNNDGDGNIFPPLFPPPVSRDHTERDKSEVIQTDEKEPHGSESDFDPFASESEVAEKADAAKTTDDTADKIDETAAQDLKTDNAAIVPSEPEIKQNDKDASETPTEEIKKAATAPRKATPTARKTTSAGKSVSAKKSVASSARTVSAKKPIKKQTDDGENKNGGEDSSEQ